MKRRREKGQLQDALHLAAFGLALAAYTLGLGRLWEAAVDKLWGKGEEEERWS